MAKLATHKGRITEITPELTTVEIVSESACSACHAKSLCSLGESKAKTVQLPTSGWTARSVGDEVTVAISTSMGHKAVWIAYVGPLCVLMAVLLILTGLGLGELPAGLCAICAVALYYFGVWLLRGRLQNECKFSIID